MILSSITVQKKIATQILQNHADSLSELVLPMEVAQTLYTEGVISKDTLDEIESLDGSLTDCPLIALSNTVSNDPNQLKLFTSILLQSKETVLIGEDILRECGKINSTN